MRTGRNVHVPKTPERRRQYRRYLETADYEPTVDERVDLGQSSHGGIELSAPTAKERRPVSFIEEIKDHLSKNWIGWVLTALALGIGYLMFDSKVAFTTLDIRTTNQDGKIIEIEKNEAENLKGDHAQDLIIQKNEIMLRDLQKDVSKTENEVEKLKESKKTK